MKNKPKGTSNPFATNKGGMIKTPKNTTAGEPKSEVLRGDDLRASAGKTKTK